ncbi:aminotransferase class V-fold PLP-dependent enzyme [Mycolicibacterium brisbanense]|uniref:Selenocysteine lyase n=1 Tax=Mycolicibacterium brisbanense TaxID=146020 RepID=A0A124DZV4_9MYCO|nr:aminotransferase class V-fold PLP-dependent enzyme [Mycolicibacterium brisbanense]MCV7158715.1 aminotransferase class V-fold PLP-dependent enzyme [Mycolicibacterium brisbanense]GAS88563.1 selenocysteine lyase [Mycolicibacterium brisbanense]
MRTAFGAEFAGAEGFLNTPTFGLPPQFLLDALHGCLGEWQAGTMQAASFDDPVRAGRAGYAQLAGVPVESVAMAGNVSAALGLVAAAIPDGSRVAVLSGEFTSTTFPFAAQGRGVTVTELTPTELIDRAADFDAVSVSLVQSANGAVLDLAALRAAVQGADTITVIDLTQALGWACPDVSWVDVTVAAVYKWLLAPRGTAWMSLCERVAATMTPHAANWYAGEQPWQSIYGLPLRLADDARRFDTSPAWFSVLGAGLTLPWLASLDRGAVKQHTVGLANRLRAEIELPQQDSAIVSIPIADAAERLQRAGIRASMRAGALRVGFHLYNTEDDLDRLVDALGASR